MENNTKEVLLMKLVNGEEIIAEVEDGGNAYLCTNAIALFMTQNEENQMTMGITDYMPYASKEGFVLNRIAVVAFSKPNEAMMANYNRRFSKIELPKEKKIITG